MSIFIFYIIFLLIHRVCNGNFNNNLSQNQANPKCTEEQLARVAGGVRATDKENKHQVSLREKNQDSPFGSGHYCGGSLISPSTIISAAHCFELRLGPRIKSFPVHNIRVVMGTLNRFKRDKYTLVFNVRSRKIHPGYKLVPNGISDHDIALVWFIGVVSNHPKIQPVPLAEEPPKVGALCTVSGWGYTNKDSVSRKLYKPHYLLMASLEVQANNGCTILSGLLKEGKICLKDPCSHKIRTICSADSGGPLICDDRLAGVASFSIKCDEFFGTSVYTSIPTYRSWLNSTGGQSCLQINLFLCSLGIFFATFGIFLL